MHLSEAGRLAQAVWEDLPHHYPHVQIDVWVIMPNHMHGIIILTEVQATEDDMQSGADPKTDVGAKTNMGIKTNMGTKTDVGAGLKPAPTAPTRHGLSEIVRAFKTFSARRINALHNTVGTPFWQRNYYEHVIRNESALDRIRQYIVDNPARWREDPENPAVRDG
ncbi:MAG: transposase [Gemmatimonadetes bacterium]|nr:transposase [Gemmatimonadota bacterium]